MEDTSKREKNTQRTVRTGKRRKKGAARGGCWKILILAALAAVLFLLLAVIALNVLNRKTVPEISSNVEKYRPDVEKYAAEAGIPEYVDYLMAIMQVESGGNGKDVMQSSESLGLPRNTLETQESIKQGCAYLAENLKEAEKYGCDTLSAVQAYNFGIDYIWFISERGGKQSIEIAEEFAKEKSGGKKVRYLNKIAIDYNGGYRYQFGNMFYAEQVRRIVEEKQKAAQ